MRLLMAKDKTILIKNIYYMLTYAFQVLKQSSFGDIAAEPFKKIEDLLAAILAKGLTRQIKQGLYREYVTKQDILPVLRGKIDFNEAVKQSKQCQKRLPCLYDELSENNLLNQILKTTVCVLLRSPAVAIERKEGLRSLLPFLETIVCIDPASICWSRLRFQRNNKNYQLLINVCYFVLHDLLPTTEKGDFRMSSFSDEHLEKLFERFVLEYYKYHYRTLHVKAAQVKWNVDQEREAKGSSFLPIMKTDVFLSDQKKHLIIDTKYYTRSMQSQFGTRKFHSNNLYQIYTYVKNYDIAHLGNVAGMLLYARTNEVVSPDGEFNIDGNCLMVKTVDLNQDFSGIAKQLDGFVQAYFGELEKTM